MKFKLLTYIFGVLSVLIGILYYVDIKAHKKTIINRELTITNYQKVMNAIGRTGGVSINKLKKELKKEFNIEEKIGYANFSKEYYYDLFPKKSAVNTQAIWTFTGLQLVMDEQKEFKTISLYKP